MFSTLRTRFGIPGVISVIALVFAMFGGAYAASNSASGGKATASAKAKKGPRGPKGATGPAGPAGPAGPQGPAGTKGDTGAAGSNGSNGTSATTESFTGAAHGCTAGGVVVKSASPETVVCNGANGKTGFTEFLPSEKTETGVWSLGEVVSGSEPTTLRLPISFSIPLEEALGATQVHYINAAGKEVTSGNQEVDSQVCHGTATNPTAEPGNLCIYTGSLQEVEFTNLRIQKAGGQPAGNNGASTAGAVLIAVEPKEEALGNGTWAVTAE